MNENYFPIQFQPIKHFPIEMLEAILSRASVQLSDRNRFDQEIVAFHDRWTQRVEAQADYLIQRIIRGTWLEPPASHPFKEEESCGVLADICGEVIHHIGVKVVGNQLFSFVCGKLEMLDENRRHSVWRRLGAALRLKEADHRATCLGKTAGNGEQENRACMDKVTPLDSASREMIIKRIEHAHTLIDYPDELRRQTSQWMHFRINGYERRWFEEASQNEIWDAPGQRGTGRPEDRIIRIFESTGSMIAWCYAAEELRWRETGARQRGSIQREALIDGVKRLKRMLPCKDSYQGQQVLQLGSTLEKCQRNAVQ
jgi:hypothetical protein